MSVVTGRCAETTRGEHRRLSLDPNRYSYGTLLCGGQLTRSEALLLALPVPGATQIWMGGDA